MTRGMSNRVLGNRLVRGSVGYAGNSYSPVPESYQVQSFDYTTFEDSGEHPFTGQGLSNLFPLVMAELYECAFALEDGPLSTWMN